MSARPSPKRRRINDPKGLRGRVLDAAAAAFQSRGYNATTMHDVVAAAGATGGATYHHFSTKKALGLAVVRERVAQEIEETWIRPIQTAKSTADGVLTVFARVIAELEVRGTVAGCPVNNLALELSLADPEFREAVHTVFERWRAAIADRIRDEQATGGLGGADAAELATFIVACYSGSMALAKAEQTTVSLKACALQLAQILAPRRPAVRPTR